MIMLGVSADYPPGLLLGFPHSRSVFAGSEGNVHFLNNRALAFLNGCLVFLSFP